MTPAEQMEAALHAMMRASPNTKIKAFYPMIKAVLDAVRAERGSGGSPGDGPVPPGGHKRSEG